MASGDPKPTAHSSTEDTALHDTPPRIDTGSLSIFDQHNRKIKLREEHLQPPVDRCHLCAGPQLRQVGQLQQSPDVNLLECQRCRVVSASRLPTESTLVEYYTNYYAKDEVWTTTYPEGTSNHMFARIGHQLARRERPIRILDFGGGDATIAILLGQRLVRAGVAPVAEVTLADFNARDRSVPAEIRFYHYLRLEHVPPEQRFDIVIASGILEHLLNANEVLASLLLRLEAQGFFYARTPFMIAFHKLFSWLGLRSPIPYPGHLHDMGRDYWDRVVGVLGLDQQFRLVASNTAVVEVNLFSRRWLVAALSHILKAPSHLPFLRDRYDFVGGWEAFIQRTS